MKKLIALFFLLCLLVNINAQKKDTIYYVNGEKAAVKITKVNPSSVEYMFPGDSFQTVSETSSIEKIHFVSGRVQTFTTKNSSKLDQIYFRGGKVIQAKINRVSGKTIEVVYEGENVPTELYKNVISKIVYSTGREEVFPDMLNVKIISSKRQWADVVVTRNVEDTYGFEKVKELSESSYSLGLGNRQYQKTLKELQQEAADEGCGLVLITESARKNTRTAGKPENIRAIAYRIPMSQKDINQSYERINGSSQPSTHFDIDKSDNVIFWPLDNSKEDLNLLYYLMEQNLRYKGDLEPIFKCSRVFLKTHDIKPLCPPTYKKVFEMDFEPIVTDIFRKFLGVMFSEKSSIDNITLYDSIVNLTDDDLLLDIQILRLDEDDCEVYGLMHCIKNNKRIASVLINGDKWFIPNSRYATEKYNIYKQIQPIISKQTDDQSKKLINKLFEEFSRAATSIIQMSYQKQ